jgi:hypothetical protein
MNTDHPPTPIMPEPAPPAPQNWMITLQIAPGCCLYLFGHTRNGLLYSDYVTDAQSYFEQDAKDTVTVLVEKYPHLAPYFRARPIP